MLDWMITREVINSDGNIRIYHQMALRELREQHKLELIYVTTDTKVKKRCTSMSSGSLITERVSQMYTCMLIFSTIKSVQTRYRHLLIVPEVTAVKFLW